MPSSEILCVGEVLWDALPAGLFLGGAPFNVACHLSAADVPVTMVSRVGADQLGEEALRRAARYGVGTELVQVDSTLPTGFVRVEVDEAGNPEFDIVTPAAWDAITPSDALLKRAANARAIVFGSLAQRNAVTRSTIERLWDTVANTETLLVFDANLRAPYDDLEVVRRSLRRADVVKITDQELRQFVSWFDLADGAQHKAKARQMVHMVGALAETFGCRTVCVTRERQGAGLWRDGHWTEHPGFEVEVHDTVGAGDAFLAVLLAGLLRGVEDQALLLHATLIGAYVATQPGAVPADQPAVMTPVRDTDGATSTPSAAPTPRERGRRARGKPPAPRRERSGD
jgi:fructokinase